MAKQESKDKLKSIYGYVVDNYDNMPTDYETFSRFMQDEGYANKIHALLIEDQNVKVDTDYNTFADKVGLKKKAVSPTSATTSKPVISGGQAEPKRTIAAPSTELPSDATATAPPVEQLLPAQQAQRKAAQEKRSEEVKTKAYETVKKLKDIQYKEANNIPVDPSIVPTRDELRQSEIDLEAANFGSEQDRQLIRKALGDTGQNRAEDMAGRVLKGIFSIAPDALNTVGIVAKKIDDAFGGNKPLEQYQTYKWAKGTEQLLEDYIKTNPYYDEDLSSTISSGLGQIIPQLALAVGSGGTSTLPQLAGQSAVKAAGKQFAKQVLSPSTLLASNTVFNSTFKDAIANGADFDTAFAASLKTGGATSLITYLPLENILKSVDGIGAVGFKEYLKNVGKSGLSEGLEEATEQWYGNLTAQEMYDVNRKLTDGIYENGAGGAAVGSFLAGMLGLPKALRRRAKETNDPILEQQATEMEQAIAEANKPPVEVAAQAEPELMPNVPVDTQQVLGNNPQPTPTIDVEPQPVEEAPIEQILTAFETADASGNGVTDIQVNEIVEQIQQTVGTQPTAEQQTVGTQPTAEQKTVAPATKPTPEQLEAEGISTEPILDPQTLPRLNSVDEVPTSSPQPLYIGVNTGGVLLKDTEGKVYSPSGNVSKLVDEAIDKEPEIFDNGNQPDVPEEIDNEQDLFDFYMQSDNPLYIAEAVTVAESLGDTDVEGSREQVLTDLVLSLTPAEIEAYTGNKAKDSAGDFIFGKIKGNKTETPLDTRIGEYEGITTDDVFAHLDFLAKNPRVKDLIANYQRGVFNTAKEQALQKFKDLTGIDINEDQARRIVASNPYQSKRVVGQDEQGLILSPQRQYVYKEEAVTTDEFANPVKTERQKVRRTIAQQKIIANAEKSVATNLAKLAEANPKSDVQAALDKVKNLLTNGGLVQITANSGAFPVFTKEGKAAISELIKAISASGIKKVRDIAQQLYDTLPDNIKGNTTATDFEPLVEEVLGKVSGTELKDTVRSLVKLYKELNPTKIYEKSPVYDYVKGRIGDALGELKTDLRAEIEALVDAELKPKKQENRFETKAKGEKKDTEQFTFKTLSKLTQRLIDTGKVNIEYTVYGRKEGYADAVEFVKNNSMQQVIDYIAAQGNDPQYPYVAKIIEDYLRTQIETTNDADIQKELTDLLAIVVNNRKEKISQSARNTQAAAMFIEDNPDEVLQFEEVIKSQREPIHEALGVNKTKEQIELDKAEAARVIKEEQDKAKEEAKERIAKELLAEARAINRKLRQQLGQAQQKADQNIDDLIRENAILAKAVASKKAQPTSTKAKPASQKVTTARRNTTDKLQNLAKVFTDGDFFEKGAAMSIGLPPISEKGRQALKDAIAALATEGVTRLQAVAERVYELLPQSLKDNTKPAQWEDYILSITEEVNIDRVNAGVKNLSERISKDVQDRILKGEATAQDKQDPVANILAELYQIYRQETASSDKPLKQPKSAAQLVEELVLQYEEGSKVWTEAQNKIDELYGDNEVVMEALGQYFDDTPLNLPVAKKTIQKLIREYVKGTGNTLEQIIRSRENIIKQTGASTREIFATLMPDVSLDVINRLVEAVETETAIVAKAKAEQILERYFANKERQQKEQKTIKQRMLEDIRLKQYTDADNVIAGINVKYGTDIQTVEELDALNTALEQANTNEEVNEALKTYARWTPEGAKLAQRITKSQDRQIAEAESNAILDPIALTLKALHDVAKQNKVIGTDKKAKPSVIDAMRAVIGMQNKGEANRIWETAQAIIDRELERRFENDPQGLADARQQIAEYFGHTPLTMAIPRKDFVKAANEKLKELLQGKTLLEAIQDYDDIGAKTKLSLKEVLLQGFDLTPQELEAYTNIIDSVVDEINKKTGERAAKRLQPQPPKARAERTPLAVKISQLLALKGVGVTDTDIDELIRNKYGMDIPATILNELEAASRKLAIAYKNGGKNSSVYKAASREFEAVMAKIKELNFLTWASAVGTGNILASSVGRGVDIVSNAMTTFNEIVKTATAFPITTSKAEWKKYLAKLKTARAIAQGFSQGKKISALQIRGIISDVNRFTVNDATSIEAMSKQQVTSTLPFLGKFYLPKGVTTAFATPSKIVFRLMSATDSLLTSEMAYQKALFEALIQLNPQANVLSAKELAQQAYDEMYGNEAKQVQANIKAFVEVFNKMPNSIKIADIQNEAKALGKEQALLFKARVLETLQQDINEDVKNEARRQADIQAFKGEQFGAGGLFIDFLQNNIFTQTYGFKTLFRFTGTAMKIVNMGLDYTPYGFLRAANKGIGQGLLAPLFAKTNGRVLGTRVQVYDPQGKMSAETKQAIETNLKRQQLGRAIFGTLLYSAIVPAIFAALGDDEDVLDNEYDIIGSMEAYPKAYRDVLKQAGVKPNSIKIGDSYLNFELFGPAAMIMALVGNQKDFQNTAKILKDTNPDKYGRLSQEGADKLYEFVTFAYTNPSALANTGNSIVASTPVRNLARAATDINDAFKFKQSDDEEGLGKKVIETTTDILGKQVVNVFIPQDFKNLETYIAGGLEKAGYINVAALAVNNDKRFDVSMAYMAGLGDVYTSTRDIQPIKKLDAFGNIYQREPNEYRMPVKVFERNYAEIPIVKLQIESGVVKLPSAKKDYIGKDGQKVKLDEYEMYQFNLEAGKNAQAEYLPEYISQDLAELETNPKEATKRIQETLSAVLDYSRKQYLYNKYGEKMDPVAKKELGKSVAEARRKIKSARK